MSELQMALAAAGFIAVGGVWGYNVWQERKHRKIAERLFKGEQADALLGADDQVAPDAAPAPVVAEPVGDFRVEPRIESRDEPRTEPRIEPRIDFATPAQESHKAAPVVVAPEIAPVAAVEEELTQAPYVPAMTGGIAQAEDEYAPWADPMVDCIVRFDVVAGVSAPMIWSLQSRWCGQVGKSLRWLARDRAVEPWRLISQTETGRYSQWLAAVQLADRRGAISDNELGQFIGGLHQLSAELGAAITLPDRNETLRRAQALDNFCASVDIQFSLHVVDAQGGSFAGTKLRGVFEAAGLVLLEDGCFHGRNSNGAAEFLVANIGNERFDAQNIRSMTTHGITLTLDVPRVADGVLAFDRMVAAARQFERGLGGKLVDAQRAPLAEAMIRGIRGKVAEIHKALLDAGIAPGGARAMKLFS